MYFSQILWVLRVLPDSKAATVTKTLVDAGISAEEICAAIDATDPERVKDGSSSVVSRGCPGCPREVH